MLHLFMKTYTKMVIKYPDIIVIGDMPRFVKKFKNPFKYLADTSEITGE